MSEYAGAADARDGPDARALRQEIRAEGHARIFNAGNNVFAAFAAPPPAAAVLRTLPRDTADFTGREGELRELLREETAESSGLSGSSGTVPVHAVHGMPGVGKTALVTRAAHLLAERYSDGQLFVDLHAHTPGREPVRPEEVLATLLLGLGVAPRDVPDGVDARSAMWRDQLAGRR
ncbi:AfsR family transcriptional regulator, partial [Streptomyces sp. NPDC006356]